MDRLSELLPTRMRLSLDYGPAYVAEDFLEECGVEFQHNLENEPFVRLLLPAGWRRVPETMHSSLLIDSTNAVIAKLHHSRHDALLTLAPTRYRCVSLHAASKFSWTLTLYVEDCETRRIIYTTTEARQPTDNNYDVEERGWDRMRAWLDREFPNWKSPAAHWSDPWKLDQ